MTSTSLLRAALVFALSSPLFACGGGAETPDSGRRDALSASDDATTEFPDAASTPDAPISSEDAFSVEDAFSSEDAASSPTDGGGQSDAGSGGGTSCGGRGRPPCARGTFCNFPPSSICGRADGPGVCTPVPASCTREYVPVCGCDGTTYSNACEAARASVSVETTGECPISCDPDLVTCDGIAPRCARGSVPSVAAGCWTGDCVAIEMCACTTFDDCPMISGVSEVCYTAGHCGVAL